MICVAVAVCIMAAPNAPGAISARAKSHLARRAADWLILADTDRNNRINDDDLTGRDVWTKERGAFFLVNCNNSNGRTKRVGTRDVKVADGLEFDVNERADREHLKIEDANDLNDITPFMVNKIPTLAGQKVFLKAPLAQIRAVHVFPRIVRSETSIWGGPTETRSEIDITAFVSADDPIEMGLEGLKFRYTTAGSDMTFDGLLDLSIEIRGIKEKKKANSTDQIELKVAPWIMLPNSQASISLYAIDAGADNKGFIDVLTKSGQLVKYSETGNSQWAQDPVEVGYSSTPRRSIWVTGYTFHHTGQNDNNKEMAWVRENLLNEESGIYRLPRVGEDSFDYGGDLELMPPTKKFPLGRICIGEDMSGDKRSFLKSQEVQEPFTLKTGWLLVGHVDEMIGFYSAGNPMRVVVASPELGYSLIGDSFNPGPDRPRPPPDAVLFSTNTKNEADPGFYDSGLVRSSSQFDIEVDKDFTSQSVRYIRIYDGPGTGQVAEVNGTIIGNRIPVRRVWGPFALHLPQVGGLDLNFAGGIAYPTYTPPYSEGGWFELPTSESKYIVVENTEFWKSGSTLLAAIPDPPAVISFKEFQTEAAPLKANNEKIQVIINKARAKIIEAAKPSIVTFLDVPVIYTGDPTVGRLCSALLPGLANFQLAGRKKFFPWPHGPKVNKDDVLDIFEQAVKDVGIDPVEWVNDWKLYHELGGEVHCGSNVKRKMYSFKWWERQP